MNKPGYLNPMGKWSYEAAWWRMGWSRGECNMPLYVETTRGHYPEERAVAHYEDGWRLAQQRYFPQNMES